MSKDNFWEELDNSSSSNFWEELDRQTPNNGQEYNKPKYQFKKEEGYLPLIGKSMASGVENLLNLPKNLATLNDVSQNYRIKELERLAKKYPHKAKEIRRMNAIWGDDESHIGEKIPAFGTIAKKKLGIGEPIPGDNALKQYASFLGEYATPAGILGGTAKGASIIGKTGAALERTAKAAGLGTAVFVAEKQGVPGIAVEALALKKGKIPFLTKNAKLAEAERKVAELLYEYGTQGKGNLNNILKFDEKAKRVVTPVTAEVAQNTGISNIHNAIVGNSPSISEKMILNDSILNKELQKIGKNLNLDSAEMAGIVRKQIEGNLKRAISKRSKITAPLYERLDRDTTRVKPLAFNEAVENSAKKQIGDTQKKIENLKNPLRLKQKDLVEPFNKKLSDLEGHELGKFTPEYKDIVKKIKHLSETATPSQIDKMITTIGEKISKLKENPAANRTLIREFTKIKIALESDLKGTASGLTARKKYSELSADVNKIERNKLLNQFTGKDKYGEHKVAVDKLLDSVLSAPMSSVKAFKAQIKNTKSENTISAFIRKKYLGAAEEGLPTYHKSKEWIRTYGTKARELLTPEDYNRLINTKVYLNNRNKVQTAGKVINSTTNEKKQMVKNISEYLGKKYDASIWAKIYAAKNIMPFSKSVLKYSKKRNIAYEVLEDAMTDPLIAKRLLQSLNPNDAKIVKDMLPTIIMNELNM